MPHAHLKNLARTGSLKPESATDAEVTGLYNSGLARLRDARNRSLSIESRFDLAYNTAHALSLAGLRRAGYRSDNRYLVFQCLQHTLDLPSEQGRVLDQAHRKRNLAECECAIDSSEELLDALVRTAQTVADRLANEVN
jgi:hypothetical protein